MKYAIVRESSCYFDTLLHGCLFRGFAFLEDTQMVQLSWDLFLLIYRITLEHQQLHIDVTAQADLGDA
jgi:hypothetical protein